MKKLLYFIAAIAIIGLTIYFVKSNKETELEDRTPATFLVVTETHYYLNDGNDWGDFTYFTDQEDFKLVNSETEGFMQSKEIIFKFPLDDYKIEKIHNEYLNGKLYYGYKVLFKLPHIEGGLYVPDFYLKLINEDNIYEIYLGELFLDFVEENDKYLEWNSFEATKVDDEPKIDKIIIGIKEPKEIQAIYLGNEEVRYIMTKNQLIVDVPDDVYMFLKTYVKIITVEGITYIPQFKYITNFELLTTGNYIKYLE